MRRFVRNSAQRQSFVAKGGVTRLSRVPTGLRDRGNSAMENRLGVELGGFGGLQAPGSGLQSLEVPFLSWATCVYSQSVSTSLLVPSVASSAQNVMSY